MLVRVLCALTFVAWAGEAPRDKVVYFGPWQSPLASRGLVLEVAMAGAEWVSTRAEATAAQPARSRQ